MTTIMTEPADQPLIGEQEAAKKPTRKKAAAPAVKKPTRKKTAPVAEEPEEAPAPAKTKAAPVKAEAPAKPAKAKRVTRKKAATEDEVPAPAVEAPPAPAAPPVEEWKPRATATPAPQSAQPAAPARPLYVPREVESFLRAAGLPIPSEKAQLDAIIAAMHAAKAAAQGIFPAAGDQAQPAQAPVRQERQDYQGQGGRNNQRNFRRDQRDQRNDQRDQRDQREPREPREPRDPSQQQQNPPAPRPEPEPEELVEVEGYCEVSGKGFGFLRDPKRAFMPHPADVFVTPEAVKKYGLRDGFWLKVEARKGHRGLQVHRVVAINDCDPELAKTWPSFEDLTTISPLERYRLETTPDRYTTRVMDLMTPIGKGQRGLIVAPPRTGKTTLLQHIADAMVKNHPEVKLLILLVDERPEEVTEIKRTVPSAELWASSNDMDVKSHTRVATLAIERARRLVECGKDVFILLDSITRLGRAFNNAVSGGGRTMSGGVDSRALEVPRKIFAAARNTEEAGSLTIVATALIETGSRMDDLIFQEFKGTGNMELVLDRKVSDQRVYPAVDIFQSGTRRDELLIPADDLHKISIIRRGLAGHKPLEAIERILSFLKKFPTNAQMLREIPG